MGRPKEPRTFVLTTLTVVRKLTLELLKDMKRRDRAMTSKRWENLASYSRYLAELFLNLADHADTQGSIETDAERKGI